MKRPVEMNRMTYREQKAYKEQVPFKFVVPAVLLIIGVLGYFLLNPQKAHAENAPPAITVTYNMSQVWICREKHMVPVILKDDSLFCAEINEKEAK